MRHAFSLVELSIVLVILGLLVGGILAGQSLIRAAELRSYVAYADQIRTGTLAFRDKYFQLPGDMSNATAFWGSLGGDGSNATCQNLEAVGTTATCNGDGNGEVATSYTSLVNFDERFRFWQHLANAGVLSGTYTGRTDSTTSGSFVVNAGKNMPRMQNGNTYDVVTAGAANTTPVAGVYPFVGTPRAGSTLIQIRTPNNAVFGILTPAETWNLDTKLDDGRPAYGRFLAPQSSFSSSPGCTTSDDPATAAYSLANGSKVCSFRYILF